MERYVVDTSMRQLGDLMVEILAEGRMIMSDTAGNWLTQCSTGARPLAVGKPITQQHVLAPGSRWLSVAWSGSEDSNEVTRQITVQCGRRNMPADGWWANGSLILVSLQASAATWDPATQRPAFRTVANTVQRLQIYCPRPQTRSLKIRKIPRSA